MTQWQFEFHFQKNVDFVINVTFSRKSAKIRHKMLSKLFLANILPIYLMQDILNNQENMCSMLL